MAVKLVPFLFQTVVAESLKPVIEPTSQSPEVVLVPLPVTDQPQMPPLSTTVPFWLVSNVTLSVWFYDSHGRGSREFSKSGSFFRVSSLLNGHSVSESANSLSK